MRSPGELVEPVTLERLRRRERIHTSRNPRIVRVLTDFGYMRAQGEGIPRMFDAMEREGLYPPELDLEADAIFTVTLKNTPIYRPETMRWLTQFQPLGLSSDQKRLLAHAREHGDAFTSRAYRQLAHLDVYAAQRDIRDLIRKGLVQLPQKGGRVFQISTANRPPREPPEQYVALEPILRVQGYVRNRDVREALGISLSQATRVTKRLVDLGWLRPEGEDRARRYVTPE